MTPSPSAQDLLRDLAPQVLGAVIRRFRDFAASEDAVQEALIAAATQWPRDGLPENPRAWLIQVASRRVADHVRAETARRNREAIVVSLVPPEEQLALAADEADATERDDTLDLLFMCCHPVLSSSSAIALTLRAVGGLTTFEIAKAFLVPEATMAQRISRAKQSIKISGVPFKMPEAEERAARLGAVMHVLYLILGLYGLLQRMSDNPMVTLNHAIALAMVHGLAAGLERLDAPAEDPRLQGHHRLDAVRAHFLERAGDHEGAIAHYRHAAERTTSTSERDYLLMQAARLSETRK
jgi:RNA polymerase sigma factor (sigma-70 family)